VVLRENLRHVIISDELSLVELREYPFSEGILDWFKDNLREPCEDAVLPVSVSEKSVKAWMGYFQPRTWLRQDAAPGRGWFNAPPAVCAVKIAASSRSSIPST
jgi:hypothetical protein